MKITFSAISVFLFLLCIGAPAQQEGISSFSNGSGPGGYVLNGGGFAFSPNVPIAITALGFGGYDLVNWPYRVSIYDSIGNQLATVIVTTNSTFFNQTYYQSISALDLTAGDTYYIGAGEEGNGDVWVGSPTGSGVGGSFAINPDISYLGYAGGVFTGSPTVQGGQSYFLVDENFQFTVVPEPSVLCLSAAGLLGIAWRRRRN
jgi:hypothetical protein